MQHFVFNTLTGDEIHVHVHVVCLYVLKKKKTALLSSELSRTKTPTIIFDVCMPLLIHQT